MSRLESRPIEVMSFGESLVDFLPNQRGVPLRNVESFRKVVGGAPTNMALGLARLGRRSALHGKIGDDEFGRFILETLDADGVDTRGVIPTSEAKTGLTFVTLDDGGDRSFLFYRDPSADMLLRPDDVDDSLIAKSQVFQFGSNLLTQPGVREATYRGLEAAVDADCIISIDPNLRMHLWPDENVVREDVLELAENADIFKVNEEELEVLAPGKSGEEAWRQVFEPMGVSVFVVTLGPRGAVAFSATGRASAEAPSVAVVDTTGAGDGFMCGLLAGLAPEFENPDRDSLESALELGCHVGSTVCTELGATPPLPYADDLPKHLREVLS